MARETAAAHEEACINIRTRKWWPLLLTTDWPSDDDDVGCPANG